MGLLEVSGVIALHHTVIEISLRIVQIYQLSVRMEMR